MNSDINYHYWIMKEHGGFKKKLIKAPSSDDTGSDSRHDNVRPRFDRRPEQRRGELPYVPRPQPRDSAGFGAGFVAGLAATSAEVLDSLRKLERILCLEMCSEK
jgi:hypothetical protein